jgi:pyruvate-ferredoxin/flavodoxin oxidoreductase
MSYGHVYVARVAIGARGNQTVTALREAEAHPGPSLVIAYSACVAHGYDLSYNAEQQRLAVSSGVWPLYRFDPARAARGEPPLQLDSGAPRTPLRAYMANETRFRMVERLDPQRFKRLQEKAQEEVHRRYALYEQLSHLTLPEVGTTAHLLTGQAKASTGNAPEPETIP